MKHATIKRSVGCFALTWVLAMTTGLLAVRPVDAFARTGAKSSAGREPKGASRAADSVNAFASELLRAETTDGASPHNLVVSPWSIVGVLTMARAGAKARTAAEIDAMLHVTDPSSQYANVHALDLALAARNHTNVDQHRPSSVQLAIADRTYAQVGGQVVPTFSELLAQQFDGDLGAVDFEHSPDQARATINAWVADRTQGQVRQLLTSADITRATRLVLVDAAYLHADWETPFDKALTLKRVFHSPNRDTTARFMHREAPMPYATGDGWQAVELPYSGNQLVLDVILPDRGRFNQVMQAAPGMLSHLPHFANHSVALALPAFHLTSHLELAPALSALGMRTAFSTRADFSGITSQPKLVLGSVIHQATVTVDEQGTTAAAATASGMLGAARLPGLRSVTLNRPFLYALRDRTTGTVLFTGIVANPSSS